MILTILGWCFIGVIAGVASIALYVRYGNYKQY